MIASQFLAVVADQRLARRPHRRQRDDVDLGADALGARDRLARSSARRISSSRSWLDVVQMVGLGRGEQDAVDARAEDRGERRGAAGAKRAHHLGQRVFEIAHRRRAGIQRAERVDQHDLPVEPAEMVAEERLHDMRLIGLVAPLHHRRERSRRRLDVLLDGSGAKVSAGEPSRSPGIRKRPGGSVESA